MNRFPDFNDLSNLSAKQNCISIKTKTTNERIVII